jgi:hypothetical protein
MLFAAAAASSSSGHILLACASSAAAGPAPHESLPTVLSRFKRTKVVGATKELSGKGSRKGGTHATGRYNSVNKGRPIADVGSCCGKPLAKVDWSELDRRGYVWVSDFLPNRSITESIVSEWKRTLLVRHSRDRSTYLPDGPHVREVKHR